MNSLARLQRAVENALAAVRSDELDAVQFIAAPEDGWPARRYRLRSDGVYKSAYTKVFVLREP